MYLLTQTGTECNSALALVSFTTYQGRRDSKTVVKKSNVNLGKIVNKSEGKASSTGKFAAELKPRIKPEK